MNEAKVARIAEEEAAGIAEEEAARIAEEKQKFMQFLINVFLIYFISNWKFFSGMHVEDKNISSKNAIAM